MSEPLSLKSIGLAYINRILNPKIENRAIGVFLVVGLMLTYAGQPMGLSGDIKLSIGFLDLSLRAGNEVNWFLLLPGVLSLAYAGFALFKLKLSQPSSFREKFAQLLLSLGETRTQLENVQIQDLFRDLFKIDAPVPVIKKLLSVDDPTGAIYDYRFAKRLVSLNDDRFKSENQNLNHQDRIRFYSLAYKILSFVALLCVAAPLFPFLDTTTRQQFSLIGFPFGIILAVVAALILSPIRAHSAAMRLISLPAGESQESRKDMETILKLFNEIHTPTFDNFIYYGRHHMIDDRIFHFWIGVNALVIASDFHIYDEALRAATLGLHKAWGKSLSFGQYFEQTSNNLFHRFVDRHDIYKNALARTAYEEFSVAIDEADRELRSLIALVRKKFPKIDIGATNVTAFSDYQSHNSAVVE